MVQLTTEQRVFIVTQFTLISNVNTVNRIAKRIYGIRFKMFKCI
jgi:hypothetical protein